MLIHLPNLSFDQFVYALRNDLKKTVVFICERRRIDRKNSDRKESIFSLKNYCEIPNHYGSYTMTLSSNESQLPMSLSLKTHYFVHSTEGCYWRRSLCPYFFCQPLTLLKENEYVRDDEHCIETPYPHVVPIELTIICTVVSNNIIHSHR